MILRRVLVTFSAGAAVGVVSALLIAILDIYLSGHGHSGLTREYFTWTGGGVHLSIGDVIMLATAMLAAALTWRLFGRAA
jgi:hypothetical protein